MKASQAVHAGLLAIVLSALLPSRAWSQPPSTSTPEQTAPRVLIVRVVDAASGQPISGASVAIGPPGKVGPAMSPTGVASFLLGPVMSVTDVAGTVAFKQVPDGRLQISALHTGYLAGSSGDQPGLDTSTATEVVLKLWRESVIRGRVYDDAGEPLINASVTFLRRAYAAGTTTWVPTPAVAKTDDRGEYRRRGLAQGDYLVLVPPPVPDSKQPTLDYGPVFYPGANTVAGASVLQVAAGGDRTGVDFVVPLRKWAGLFSMSGHVVSPEPAAGRFDMRLIPEESVAMDLEGKRVQSDIHGHFTFSNVPPGRYRLVTWRFPTNGTNVAAISGRTAGGFSISSLTADAALARYRLGQPVPPIPAGPTLYSDEPIELATQNVEDVAVTLQVGAVISGEVIFEGATIPPSADILRTVPVMIRPADGRDLGDIPMGAVESNGRFRSVGLPPGAYVAVVRTSMLGLSGLDGWQMVSVQVDGREMIGEALDLPAADMTDVIITMTQKTTAVSGTIRDSLGKPMSDAKVFIFPRDPALRRNLAWPSPAKIKQVRPDQDAHFRSELLPGEYLIAAVTRPVPEFWMMPEFLSEIAVSATPLRMVLGEQQQVDLKVP